MQKQLQSQYKRAVVADFISPDNGLRGKMERLGLKPKNHMRQNSEELKALQAKMREEKEISSMPTKELYKLSQFRNVPSKINNKENDINEENENRITNNFLSKGNSQKRRDELAMQKKIERIELEKRLDAERLVNEKPNTPRKPSIPRATEVAKLLPRSNSDFITKNRAQALTLVPPKAEPIVEVKKHEEYGRIPKYLEDRKQQWEDEQEEIKRRAPDPNCPPGMKLMHENERLETLSVLKQNREDLLLQLGKLPFVIETPSQIRRKNDIDMKLKEIENAIGLFSKTKVYIKL
eukprot:gene19230-25081_t